MKRQVFSLISLLSLLLIAGSAIAQTVHVRADIPFNFAVGNKTLPAGMYIIKTISDRDTTTLVVQAQDGQSSTMTNSNAAENLKPANKSKLVFNRYRDHYILSEIWVAGANRGRRLPKTSREKEWARDLAQDLTQRKVEIVASLY